LPTSGPPLQAKQVSLHSLSQQTPSAQNPEAHSSPVAHAAPSARVREQRPAAQKNPAWQGAAGEHGAAQVSPLHAPDGQGCIELGRHVPAPSQVAAPYSIPSAQVPGLHSVLAR
jgi:hypothetical protein